MADSEALTGEEVKSSQGEAVAQATKPSEGMGMCWAGQLDSQAHDMFYSYGDRRSHKRHRHPTREEIKSNTEAGKAQG